MPSARRPPAPPTALPLHSFDTLIADLATQCRNTCRLQADPHALTFTQITLPTELQRRAQDLIDAFPVEHHS